MDVVVVSDLLNILILICLDDYFSPVFSPVLIFAGVFQWGMVWNFSNFSNFSWFFLRSLPHFGILALMALKQSAINCGASTGIGVRKPPLSEKERVAIGVGQSSLKFKILTLISFVLEKNLSKNCLKIILTLKNWLKKIWFPTPNLFLEFKKFQVPSGTQLKIFPEFSKFTPNSSKKCLHSSNLCQWHLGN